MENRELVILGAGPAGLCAAVYAKRAGLDVLVLERALPGGQIAETPGVENWPGVPFIEGMALAQQFQEHALQCGAEIRQAESVGLDLAEGLKIVHTDQGDVAARALIICTGAAHKHLDCPGEAALRGKGVSYCAVCDGGFFRNEVVAVIGGGDTAVADAEYLARIASKVYLVHRRDTLRAGQVQSARALALPNIEPVWDSEAQCVGGERSVTHLDVRNVRDGHATRLDVSGVFVAIGTIPNTRFLGSSPAVELDPEGWIITRDEDLRTSAAGVFAAGDVRTTALRQIVTAVADGARAAMSARRHLAEG